MGGIHASVISQALQGIPALLKLENRCSSSCFSKCGTQTEALPSPGNLLKMKYLSVPAPDQMSHNLHFKKIPSDSYALAQNIPNCGSLSITVKVIMQKSRASFYPTSERSNDWAKSFSAGASKLTSCIRNTGALGNHRG